MSWAGGSGIARRVGKGALLRAVPTVANFSEHSFVAVGTLRFAHPSAAQSYSGLMFADFINGHHFSISAFW
jgi:hypothetical protein